MFSWSGPLHFLLFALPAVQVAVPPPGVPVAVDRSLAVPPVSGLAPSETVAFASASGEPEGVSASLLTPSGLPPLPEWCDGTCVIDVAFFYAPEAIGQTDADKWPGSGDPNEPYGPQTVDELRAHALSAIIDTNILFRRAGLDAELRFVGLEREPALAGLIGAPALHRVREERLAYARAKYGADLIYAITSDYKAPCVAYARPAGTSLELARAHAAGVVKTGCLDSYYGLAIRVGVNLGLLGHPGAFENGSLTPFVPFGHGYVGQNQFGTSYGSTMAIFGDVVDSFSTVEPVHGRVLGNADVSDAARALRYTIPDVARYSPTVVPERVEDPRGYGCRPSAGRACLNERRFHVTAGYSTPTVARAPAKRLDVYGLGDSAAIFYFFAPDNPEMLIKVVDGCWQNGHWWVFGSAATDLAYEVAIEDLANGGGTVRYRHRDGGAIVGDNGYTTTAGVITDTWAFACGRPAARAGERGRGVDVPSVRAAPVVERPAVAGMVAAPNAADARDYGCVGRYCVNNWRFRVDGGWQRASGLWGPTRLVPVHGLGNGAALHYFIERDNPEMLVKVVDGCAINGHWWVFGSAATDRRYELSVRDWATSKLVSEGFVRFRRWNLYQHHGEGKITRIIFDLGKVRTPHDGGYSTTAGVINDTTAFPCEE